MINNNHVSLGDASAVKITCDKYAKMKRKRSAKRTVTRVLHARASERAFGRSRSEKFNYDN